MSRAFISGVIQQSTGVTDEVADRATNDLMDAIAREMKKTGKFALSAFGSFTVRRTKARKALNPRTGESIQVKAGKTVHFKASPVLRKAADRASAGGVIQGMLAILSRWGIPDDQGSIILGSSDSDFLSALRSGDASLETRDMQDRARLLFDIYEGLYGLFRDPTAEGDWIRTRRSDLGGQSVLDLMTEGSQRSLIRALAFVDYVNGR